MKKIIVSILAVLLLIPLFNIQTAQAEVSKVDTILAVNKLTPLYVKDDNGNFTQSKVRSLGEKTAWYSDQAYPVELKDGSYAVYYRVSTNEWVEDNVNVIKQSHNHILDAQVDNYQAINAKIIKINNRDAPVYNDFGDKTGATVPANSSWRVDMSYMIAPEGLVGFSVFQRIGNNTWIKLSQDASVTATL
ncbi:hypothetical protein [Companilactobacillus mishanensis]|uniref:Surface layer protein A domain-containing protein n=1 Tax=Companilactobacillus mishanensis TaxID=2486008 RepID=A0A5P0ZKK5_9LACO|nr:hypothetical protein [Companilactobacillus mishanensis]MQS53515.1 hypothetical protein [Companilactobacillus mishanensis]